ncbi:hypothetical protein HJD18_11640 [Thermoleophilia bacterium SCSIO 60948]|nr:hypothetical protein HJD18_11640 [Thermoleophilia bacterium SCSIO 60948]
MHEIDLQIEPNEASDLARVDDQLLEGTDWDLALVTALDETPAEGSVALLVHEAGDATDSGWRAIRVELEPSSSAGRTEDAEACAIRDGWLYVIGSQFGKKSGPLEAKRSWVARAPIADVVAAARDGESATLEIARLRFSLHRAINDALAAAAVELIGLGPESREAYIDATIALGAAKEKRWAGTVRSSDHPINVEGAEFRQNGALLLGLRYPTSAEGDPLLVELDDVGRLFDEPEVPPACGRVWVLKGTGSAQLPRGVRGIEARGGDRFDAIVGNLDAADKGAVLLEDHPEGHDSASVHVSFSLPLTAGGGDVEVETVHEFDPSVKRIEGIAHGAGEHTFYVIDEDGRVGLRALAVLSDDA